jgi:outer membrane lipoprotein-sorting protein
MSANEAIKVLADRSSAIHAISAQGLITLTRDNGDTVRLDAAIVLQPPNRARLRAWKFGRAVFDMTLTPDGLWLIAPAETDRRKEIMSAGANIGNLTREWLQLITGAVEGSVSSQTEQKLNLTLPRENGSTMLCQIDRKTLTPRRYDLKDSSGVTRFTLTLNHYADIGGIVWPREIEAISPTGQVLMELHDVEINGEIPPAAFRPPARAEKIESSAPSSGTPGEGRGGGSANLLNPHPSPPPEYRRRGQETR